MMVHVVVQDNDGACGGAGQFIHRTQLESGVSTMKLGPAS